MSRSPSSPSVSLPVRPIARAVGRVLPLLAALACVDAAPDPRFRAPTALFDAETIGRLTAVAQQLEGTPLAEAAQGIDATVAECTAVFAHAPHPDAPFEFGCLETSAVAGSDHTAWVEARRGDSPGWLTWPLGDDGYVEVRFSVDEDGGLVAHGDVTAPTRASGLDLLLPDDLAPARSVFAPSRLLVHAQARPAGGLGLTRFLPDGGQADRLFALKGRLLEGALLAGTWEVGFVTPSDAGTRPLPVAALHHRGAGPIRAALDEALTRLEATWPITRSVRRFTLADGTDVEGGCYAELPLLPELAPCWAVTDSALLIGFRAGALDAAHGRPHVSSAKTSRGAGTRFRVDLAGLDRLDRRATEGANAVTLGALFEALDVELAPADAGRYALTAHLSRAAAR